MSKRDMILIAVGILLGLSLGVHRTADAQAVRIEPKHTFSPRGQRVVFDALDPTMRKWYLPQELYRQFRWKPWEYSNYAKNVYERYVHIQHQGEQFYDLYGNYITRGWLLYNWNHQHPLAFGSAILKQPEYASWFNRLLVSSDSKGQYYVAVTIGEEIRTTLTPFTFSKPAFSGVQIDFGSDKYQATTLVSRVNVPGYAGDRDRIFDETDFTNLLGFRGTVQVGDFLNIGGTYVNAHIGRSDQPFDLGYSLKGQLSTVQNGDVVRKIFIRISDDSPEDGRAGGSFFSSEILTRRSMIDTAGRRAVFKPWGPEEIAPTVEGGFQKRGYLASDGGETITLTYTIPDPELVDRIGFRLVLANDYRVEVSSDRQTNAQGFPVFLPVARAPGNVDDNSNQRVVSFDYGLPTANEIYGITFEIQDLWGIELRAELDVNNQFRRFPNINVEDPPSASDRAEAFYLSATKRVFPWFGYAEVFSVGHNYSTTMFMVNDAGEIDYDNELQYRYELVDDNDDQDRWPDWQRRNQSPDEDGVFPGLDENNDFISDFNQNDNLRPDYDEPFLRYRVDPPEFLFGMDMNNNTVIDRFEDDRLPDYPYKADHRGYNAYVGTELVPRVNVRVGRFEEWLWSSNAHSEANYGMFLFDRDYAGLGKLQIFDNLRFVKDSIPDDVLIWVQHPGTKGGTEWFRDPLVARHTMINTAYVGFEYTRIPRLNIVSKIKHERYAQRDRKIPLWIAGKRDTLRMRSSSFVGVINKTDYTFSFGPEVRLTCALKSMYRRETPKVPGQAKRDELLEILPVTLRVPTLTRSWLQLGVEYTEFWNFEDSAQDFMGVVLGVQWSNRSHFMGYELILNMGFEIERKTLETEKETTTLGFISAYAGMTGTE